MKLVGLGRAKQILLGGDELDGLHAHAAGVITELAGEEADVVEVARLRVGRMLGRAPQSFAAAKRLWDRDSRCTSRQSCLAPSIASRATPIWAGSVTRLICWTWMSRFC